MPHTAHLLTAPDHSTRSGTFTNANTAHWGYSQERFTINSDKSQKVVKAEENPAATITIPVLGRHTVTVTDVPLAPT